MKVHLSGGKRVNLVECEDILGYFELYGKEEGCISSGPWEDYVSLARQILEHPLTGELFNDDARLRAFLSRDIDRGLEKDLQTAELEWKTCIWRYLECRGE